MVVLQVFTAVVGLFLLVVLLVPAAVVAYSLAEVVEEGEVEALLVLGEFRTVIGPGLNIVPPFISTTYPVDPDTMTFDTGDDRVPLPEESHDRVLELLPGEDPEGGDEWEIEYE